MKSTDTIIFSASPIPGNTISVVNTIDRLMMLGAKVVYGKGEGIHVSGHGFQEDQKLMLALTKPKYFVPVHGEHRMLVCHSKTAQSMGVPAENILIIDNGDVVQLTPDSISKGDPVKAGIELLDASRNGIVDARVLKERQQLAEDGVITMLAVISTDGVMAAPPRVNLRGVVTAADARKLSLWAEREITWVLENRWQQLSRNSGGKAPEVARQIVDDAGTRHRPADLGISWDEIDATLRELPAFARAGGYWYSRLNEITIDDPKTYTKPIISNRTFTLRTDWEVLEYSCEENNVGLYEGRIKVPDFTNPSK